MKNMMSLMTALIRNLKGKEDLGSFYTMNWFMQQMISMIKTS